jgi:hypothetical protein
VTIADVVGFDADEEERVHEAAQDLPFDDAAALEWHRLHVQPFETDDDTPGAPSPDPVDIAPIPMLTVRSVGEALASPPVEPEELVRGMLRRSELLVLGAPRGIGKSLAAAQLAWLLRNGHGRFLGALPIVRSARVLIAQGELDQWGTYARWRKLTGDEPGRNDVLESFDRWRIRVVKMRTSRRDDGGSDTAEFLDAILDPKVEATIVEHKIDVLIIDPWAVFYAGAENSNDEVEAALDKLRDLAMRTGCAIVILHHLSKALDVREPEDAWRGASRLADWASTRVTFLPHYSEPKAKEQGMTRQQARRYVDVKFLRRAEPTDDFSIALNPETLWWERWNAPEDAAADRRIKLNPVDVADRLRATTTGEWPSVRAAADDLGLSQDPASRLLKQAARAGLIEPFEGPRNAQGYRLVRAPSVGLL